MNTQHNMMNLQYEYAAYLTINPQQTMTNHQYKTTIHSDEFTLSKDVHKVWTHIM